MSSKGPWNYIIIFSNSAGDRYAVKEFINSRDEIITWFLCMSNAIFVRSNRTATQLQNIFREFTKDRGRFLILDCKTDRGGWLPRKAWKFMKNEYP